ncbi:transglycosylase SLT domain-containing protein [Candidatus Micrarchaeota archaeon]|nr:transglycosylase SLT domain-containing protein [Candidatus Micrarchaeota archaeon]
MRLQFFLAFVAVALLAAFLVTYSEVSLPSGSSVFPSSASPASETPLTGFVSAASFADSDAQVLPASVPDEMICMDINRQSKPFNPRKGWYLEVYKKQPEKLYLYWNGRLVKEKDFGSPVDFPVPVSTGIGNNGKIGVEPGPRTKERDHKTPEGTFCLSGPTKVTVGEYDPRNPHNTYVNLEDFGVAYYKVGFWGSSGIWMHGTPNGNGQFDDGNPHLGKPASHGCIRMPNSVISWLSSLVSSNNGGPVAITIYGKDVPHPSFSGSAAKAEQANDEALTESSSATAVAEFSACPVSITKPLPKCKNPDGKGETNCISWSFKTSVKNVHKEYDTGAGGYLKKVFFGKLHGALDIELRIGTPLKAIEGGVVEYLSDEKSDCGLGVLVTTNGKNINDKDWRGYWYCHMSKIKVKKGQAVEKDAPLGLSGKTGKAPTPHVHVAMAAYNKENSRYEVLSDVDGLCKKAGGVASEQQETVSTDGQDDSGAQQTMSSSDEAPSEPVTEQTSAETGDAGKKKTGIAAVAGGSESEECPDEPSGEFTQGDYACVYFNLDENDGAKDKFFDVAFAAYGGLKGGGSETLARYAASRKGVTYPEGYAEQVAFHEGVFEEKDNSYKGAYAVKLKLKRLRDEAPTGFFLRMFLSERMDAFDSFNPQRKGSGAETEYEGITRKAAGYVVRVGVPDEERPKAETQKKEPGAAEVKATKVEKPTSKAAAGCPPFNENEKLSQLKTARGVPLNPIIEKYAKQYGLSVTLVAAMIEIESGSNENAVSPKGAVGLMQVMPTTASGSCGISGNDLFDPEKNVKCGIRYLKAQCERFKNTDLVAAAYNAGPGAVERHGGIPPYTETKNHVVKFRAALSKYVAQVSKNMEIG